MRDLLADGNSVILVDHDTTILSQADWLIGLGPEAGAKGGTVIAQGPPSVENAPSSRIGGFLSGKSVIDLRQPVPEGMFTLGTIHLSIAPIHTVQPLEVDFPKGRLIAVTGVLGSGRTTMILESLIPALEASIKGEKLPDHIRAVSAGGIA